jgi:hypothetical protein
MLWQKLPPFQPRITKIDLQYSWDRIRSPGSPSPFEMDQLSQVLSDAERDLSDYEEDIRSLESMVSDFRKKREELQRYVEHCKVYLSPIRKLPTEIMGEVFLYYQDLVGSGRDDKEFREPLRYPNSSNSQLTALFLGSMCKLWHSISLSTPRLWSRFSLFLDEDCNALSHLLKIYLLRSKQTPISFDLTIDEDYHMSSNNILSLLIAESHRWFSASWDVLCANEEVMSSLNVQRDLPLLQHIEWMGNALSADEPFGMLVGAHTPRTLTLESSFKFLDSKLRWDQLHFLCARMASSNDGVLQFIVKLTRQCPALRHLGLHFTDFPFDMPALSGQAIHLDKLESLHLENVTLYELGEIFSISTLPNLRRLSLSADNGYDSSAPNISVFSSFMERSQCPISSLHLNKFHKVGPGMTFVCEMFRYLPSLTELTVSLLNYGNSDPHDISIMKSLIHPIGTDQGREQSTLDTSDTILPLLQKLVLELPVHHLLASRIIEMVESRRIGGNLGSSQVGQGLCNFQSVTLFLWSSGSTDELPNLQIHRLEELGVEIIMCTPSCRRYIDERMGRSRFDPL